MVPQIDTLIIDVYQFLKEKKPWSTPEIKFNETTRVPNLSLSQMGPRCPCALWHSVNKPELAEALPPQALFKYNYGHMIEASAIVLAKKAGHTVTGEQGHVVVDGISGHRDCVIDGCIVDVKSTSSYGFQKFKDGSIRVDDSFGYLDQLDGYLVGSLEDPTVTVKDKAYLWGIDKTLGHMVLYEHTIREERIRTRIREYKRIVSLAHAPQCNCQTQPEGKSGNVRLDTKASYNTFKYCCFPNLRTFLYANGPVYLTKVVRKPDVTEVDRYGKIVYN